MSTVVKRTFASVPQRDAAATWRAIVDLLTKGKAGGARDELLAVTGTVASLIADQAPKDAAIVVTCDGPRTRIYCLYDDAALESDANEGALGHDPLAGDWAVSLPCPADELGWVSGSLSRHSTRITARDQSDSISIDESAQKAGSGMVLDVKGFLGQ